MKRELNEKKKLDHKDGRTHPDEEKKNIWYL